MLSTQRAPEGDHFGEQLADRPRQRVVPRRLVKVISEDVDVQVAVAGVAITDGPEAMLGAEGFDFVQQLGQLAAGHHRVFFLVRACRLDGFSHPASQKPKRVLFRRRLGKQNLSRAVCFEHGQNALALRHEVVRRKPVHFNEQMCRVVGAKCRLVVPRELLGQQDRIPLHELQGAGHGPRLEYGRHGRAGGLRRGEGHEHQGLVTWQRQQLQRGAGDHTQRPFAAHHELRQVVAG